MPSYSFNSTIQSIIQSIINFLEKLFGITRGQPIKTQTPPNISKTTNINNSLPSYIIKYKNTKISSYKLPELPIITRHNVNIENLPKISIPKLPIKIIPNKPLSQVLNNSSKTNNTSSTNTSTSSTNLSQIAINPNVPLSQTLTQGRTIIPAKHKNPNPKGNNGNNSSQSNTSNSKSIIINPIEYQLYNKDINTKLNNRKTDIIKR